MNYVDKNTHVVCDAVFRAADDFGKDIAAWPADMRVALRRALGNFRAANTDAGKVLSAQIEWSHSHAIYAPLHPWVVHVAVLFERVKLN